MQLTRQQKLNFHRDGYIKISGAVPQRMVEQALRAINHSLGEEGMNKEDLPPCARALTVVKYKKTQPSPTSSTTHQSLRYPSHY